MEVNDESPYLLIGRLIVVAALPSRAIGGFFIPFIFGHLVLHTTLGTGWVFLA